MYLLVAFRHNKNSQSPQDFFLGTLAVLIFLNIKQRLSDIFSVIFGQPSFVCIDEVVAEGNDIVN